MAAQEESYFSQAAKLVFECLIQGGSKKNPTTSTKLVTELLFAQIEFLIPKLGLVI